MTLREWQRRNLPRLREKTFALSQHAEQITLVSYSFPKEEDGEEFDWLECAILQTWHIVGALRTKIVVHKPFEKAKNFAAKHPQLVELQVQATLRPGDITTMSEDCIARLHSRFDTPHCLVVQDDGFPLRGRIAPFLQWDFAGAPYVRNSWWKNTICALLGMWVSNGGLSLRSKRICQLAAKEWELKWKQLHPCEQTIDDIFYTKTLPLANPFRRLRIAPNKEALRFSYDDIVKHNVARMPFGFHRASTFEFLQSIPRPKHTLAIAHRVCPALAKTAAFYTDKFKLVRDCATSLAKALEGIDAKVFVILDGCPEEYAKFFDELFAPFDYERIDTPSIGNQATYAKQLELLSNADADFVYFSEDDYLYQPTALREMMEMLEEPGVDFVSPLDHPDSYAPRSDSSRTSVRLGSRRHWKESASTCLTFLCKRDTLAAAKRMLSYYIEGGGDYIMWLWLTKYAIYSPRAVLGNIVLYIFGRVPWTSCLPALAWAKLGLRLFSRKFRLFTPLPSLAVHCCVPSLPPFVKKEV